MNMSKDEKKLDKMYKRLDRRGVFERAKAAYEKAMRELQ